MDALIGTTTLFASPIMIPLLIIGGTAILADSHGLISRTASDEDVFYFVLDVALAGFSAKLTKGIVDVSSRILSSISKGNSVVIGMHEANTRIFNIKCYPNNVQTCMDTARDLIISTE